MSHYHPYKREKITRSTKILNSFPCGLMCTGDVFGFIPRDVFGLIAGFCDWETRFALVYTCKELYVLNSVVDAWPGPTRQISFPNNIYDPNTGISFISRFKKLKSFDLSECYQVTDAGLAHLSSLKALTSLDLSKCYQVTDAGLVHLSSLKL